MTDFGGSDELRDELGRVAFDLARNRPCDDRTWELVKGNKKLLFWPTADAFMAVVERRVAEAKAEVERLEIWKQVATILLEKVKVNGKPALEIFDTGLAVQQKGESNE